MQRFRYSRWDGSQQLAGLDADDVMEALSDDLLDDGDVRDALRRLLNWGFDGRQGQRLRGLQQLLQELRSRRQERLDRYNLGGMLDEIRRQLDDVVRTEREGIQRRVEEGRRRAQEGDEVAQRFQPALEQMAERKRRFLDELPADLGGAVRALHDYEFMDPEAQRLFQELLQRLQQQVMQSYAQGLQQTLQGLTPEDLRRMREMLHDLNQLVRDRVAGKEPDFQRFMQRWGQYFPGVQSLDELLHQLAERRAQMQSLLESLSPEQRRQLMDVASSVFKDEGLQRELAQLAAVLDALTPRQRGYRFRGDEPLSLTEAMDLMGELQDMDRLERQLRRAIGGEVGEVDAEAVERLLGPGARSELEQLRHLMQLLEDAGYVARRGDTWELTPRGVRRIGQKALQDLFGQLKRDAFGRHPTEHRGRGGDRTDETKPYEFGDPFLTDIGRTLMNALVRRGSGSPVALDPRDFEVYRTEYLTQAATVLMVDMSRSMILRGCFSAAKRVALALNSLIRTQFPRDQLHLVVFSYRAEEIRPDDLHRLSWDYEIYGTNLQHALMLARQLLGRYRAVNKQIILVTDGEPTAHIEGGQIFFNYPPTYRTIQETLREVGRCTREGIVINTFMLERSRGLSEFVQEIARLNRGRAFFTTPERLGEYVLVDYLSSKRRKVVR